MKRQAVGQHQQSTRRQSPRSNPSNRSSQYEALRRRRHGTYQRTYLEQRQGDYIRPFGGVVRVDLAERESNRAGRQKIGTCIPRQVPEGIELLGDLWDCSRKDGVILQKGQLTTRQCSGQSHQRDAKRLKAQSYKNRNQLCSRRVFLLVIPAVIAPRLFQWDVISVFVFDISIMTIAHP